MPNVLHATNFDDGGNADVDIDGTLTVDGATTLGALDVTGGLTTDTNAFAVADTTGVVTMKNGATLDNNASASVLNITEDTVRVTGAFDVTGASTFGGGYGDTGATISNAGAISADSDVTYKGTFRAGTGGVNKDWSVWLPADGYALKPLNATGCAAPAIVVYHATGPQLYGMAFDKDTAEYAVATVSLPPSYNGAGLTFHVYWGATAGTTGDVVWVVRLSAFDDLESLNSASGSGTSMTDSFTATSVLYVTSGARTPDNASSGDKLMSLIILRNATSGSDTFDADAILHGIRISYT